MGDIDFKGLQFNLVEYISYLFNSQSLLEKLKNSYYISNMDKISTSLYVQLQNNYVITVSFILSEKGLVELEEVLLIIYKYINLIKSEGYKKDYFRDFIKFKRSQVLNNFDKSNIDYDFYHFIYIVNNYRLYGEDQILTYGTPTESNYDEKKLKNYLNKLSFDKSFFALNSERALSKIGTIFKNPETKTLKFYKSEYIFGKIPDGFKDKIDSVEGLLFRTTNKYFSNLNEKVIPCYKEKDNRCQALNEFDIKDDKYSGIRLEDNYETYYQVDKSSESSIVNSYLEFIFPENENLEGDYSIPILKIYFNHIITEINELNTVYDLEISKSKIALKIRSFTDNTKIIIQDLVEKLKSSPSEINFEYAKGSYKAQIVALKFISFQQYVFNLGNKLKNPGEPDSTNYGEIIENLYNFEFEDFNNVYNYIVSKLSSFTFKIAGNIDKI